MCWRHAHWALRRVIGCGDERIEKNWDIYLDKLILHKIIYATNIYKATDICKYVVGTKIEALQNMLKCILNKLIWNANDDNN